ncbi:Site-specific recombinase XerC [Marinibacterium anthonyi]|nr:Site-specific recombinase XerC [Marinibacterium anthonyi]
MKSENGPEFVSHDCAAYAQSRYGDGVGQRTVWTELGHLMTVLNWAKKNQLIDRVPTITRPAKPTPSERFFTREEIRRLLSVKDTPHHIHLAMLLMPSTAGRQAAILELTWERVDFARKQVNLRTDGAATRKGRAVVPMNDGLHDALLLARDAAISDYVLNGRPERQERPQGARNGRP